MRERTSSPTEPATLDALRALAVAPAWHDEPLHLHLAQTLGCPGRAARALLDSIELRVELCPSALGLLDETWLYRTRATPAPGEDVLEWTALDGGYAIVRTSSRDAVHREKVMRALHARLGERPILQLDRARPAPPKRKLARADWALARRLCEAPWPALDAKADRDRARRAVADSLVALVAWPRGEAHHALVRLSPSSTAAAQRALDALPGAFARHLPATGEARHGDAFALAADAGAAREVPGVASVDVRRVAARWRDDAAWDALFTDAERHAGA